MKALLPLMIFLALIMWPLDSRAEISDYSVENSWEEILASRELDVREPKIAFNLRYVSVFKVCFQGDQLRTIEKVMVEEVLPKIEKAENWIDIGPKYLYTPVKYQREICVLRGDNCHFETIWETHKSEYNVAVRKRLDSVDEYGSILFVKKYEVPQCSEK